MLWTWTRGETTVRSSTAPSSALMHLFNKFHGRSNAKSSAQNNVRSRTYKSFTQEGNISRNSSQILKFTCRRILYINFWRPRTSSNIATFLQRKDETAIADYNFPRVKSFKNTTFLRNRHEIEFRQFNLKTITEILTNRKWSLTGAIFVLGIRKTEHTLKNSSLESDVFNPTTIVKTNCVYKQDSVARFTRLSPVWNRSIGKSRSDWLKLPAKTGVIIWRVCLAWQAGQGFHSSLDHNNNKPRDSYRDYYAKTDSLKLFYCSILSNL